LSPEKGIGTLLQAWHKLAVPLRIVGDGPLRRVVENSTGANIASLGLKQPSKVASEMAQASFLVVPSIWPETFGMVIVEAFSHGLPVIASRIGALTEIVDDGVTGLLFSAGDAKSLEAKVVWAIQHPEEMRMMGANARKVYEHRYSPAVNFLKLKEIYNAALRARAIITNQSYITNQS
jgi:glycosyltransferase involved in cell wall biosynthesis